MCGSSASSSANRTAMPATIAAIAQNTPQRLVPSMTPGTSLPIDYARLRLAARGVAACGLARGGPRSASQLVVALLHAPGLAEVDELHLVVDRQADLGAVDLLGFGARLERG